MLNQRLVGLALGLVLLSSRPSLAVPIVSVDLDPATPGIQDTLVVDSGTSFTAELVVSAAGELMDALNFELVYNDNPGILGLSGGTGSPAAGSMAAPFPAGPAPAGVLDINSFLPVLAGDALAPPPLPFVPTPGFAGQSGSYGMLVLGFAAVAGDFSLFSLTFDARVPGTSTIAPSAGAPGQGGLSGFGVPIPFLAGDATVTVLDSGRPIPEPSNLALYGLGLLVFRHFDRRARHRRPASKESSV